MSEPVPFKQQNTEIKGDHIPGVDNLPAYVDQNQIISKWRFTIPELKRIAETGCVYIHVLGGGMPPISVSARGFLDEEPL